MSYTINWFCNTTDGEEVEHASFGPDGSEQTADIPSGTYAIDVTFNRDGYGEGLEPVVVHGIPYVVP